MTTAATLLRAVIVIDSAVSPRARWVRRLASVPPGEAPSSTRPTASAASSPYSSATAKASRGEISTRFASPIRTPRGRTKMRLKSAGVSDSPSVPMIRASASGSSTVANTDVSSTGKAYVVSLSWRWRLRDHAALGDSSTRNARRPRNNARRRAISQYAEDNDLKRIRPQSSTRDTNALSAEAGV